MSSDKIAQAQNIILNARRDGRFKTETGGPPVWLVSFTDVIALMLTFFVLLFSMMSPEPKKWDRKIGITMNNYADFQGSQGFAGAQEGINISRQSMNLAEDLQYMEALFNEIILDRELTDRIVIRGAGDRLNLFLHPNLTLNNQDFAIFLNQLEPVLDSLDNQITLMGRGVGQGDQMLSTLQALGRMIKNNGYQKPLSIRMQDMANAPMNAQMALSIESHDGRRVVR